MLAALCKLSQQVEYYSIDEFFLAAERPPGRPVSLWTGLAGRRKTAGVQRGLTSPAAGGPNLFWIASVFGES
jgi:hypothetical protein